ncbi:RdRp [Beihai barnacle virus 13]|uniref:RdRp n=1 Tax=Beihai barnacle virus 13 TaxID=1922357 RepID=UPI000909A79D|nr:RdRp [Beihai barnacle virus 13]APG78179.1 RdRp [Beihai barnacle virus 13]
MFSLPRGKGFGQYHAGERRQTPYLPEITDIPYHRSAVTLSAIRSDLKQFGTTQKIEYTPTLKAAIADAYKEFGIGDVKMLHLNDVMTYKGVDIWNRSPGLPWRQHGYKTKGEVVSDMDAQRSIRWFWHRIKDGAQMRAPDCSAFTRSHVCKVGEEKVRAVWGYPMTITMGEAVFAIPLIEAYKARGSPIAYGYEISVGGARKIFRDMQTSEFKAALDLESFDKRVPRQLIEHAFDILAQNINFMEYRDRGIADVRRNIRMWEYLKQYFLDTPVRLCTGERYLKRGGVPSGSYFTQLVDSIVNYILVVWLAYELTGKKPRYLKVMGDDSIAGLDSPFHLHEADALLRTVGMKLNVPKSILSKDVADLTFLGYKINNGIPSRPFDKWIASLVYPETEDESWDDVATRALGLLYANCGVDSSFDRLCRHIINFKPFDLHISRSLSRLLWSLGVTGLDKAVPSSLDFYLRLL